MQLDDTLKEEPEDVSRELLTATSRTRQRMIDEQADEQEDESKEVTADDGGVVETTPPETTRSSVGTPRGTPRSKHACNCTIAYSVIINPAE